METELSILIAKIIALIYLSLGVAMLTGQFRGKEMLASFERSSGLALITGAFGLIIGVLITHYHNIWVKDWPVLITLFGWIAIVESIAFIALPKTMFSMTKGISKNEKIWGFIALVLGLLFGYFGFVA